MLFTICKAQLHVSAINAGHLQVVQRKLIDQIYMLLYNNSNTSSFAMHLIQEAHSFSPMSNIKQIVHCHRKGARLNTTERFHIHTEFAANNHLNDPQTIFPNAIFNTLTKANQS
jgi:uncharacterized protein YvpB